MSIRWHVPNRSNMSGGKLSIDVSCSCGMFVSAIRPICSQHGIKHPTRTRHINRQLPTRHVRSVGDMPTNRHHSNPPTKHKDETNLLDIPSPRPSSWIVDNAGVFTGKEFIKQEIEERITKLNKDHGYEFAIFTTPTIPPFTPTAKDFATKLFNTWGIGSKDKNNGLLYVLDLSHRSIELELGKGMRPIMTNHDASLICDQLVPKFKRGDYAEGLQKGVRLADEKIRYYEGRVKKGYVKDQTGGKVGGLSALIALVVVILIALGLMKDDSKCDKCGGEMVIDETHTFPLDRGEQLEASLGAVRHVHRRCPQCKNEKTTKQILNHRFSRCWRCGYNTSEYVSTRFSGSTTIRDYDCRYCGCKYSESQSQSDSNSSSGFGGGTSSGGGGGSKF
eukprot:TRINITY_DN17358_c0_g1_i1.p1 TRINITY_DN17358_c0_g1~~TRINITY_DN17358_c0_g1_i1.p1  ORF type:complete len:391 (-),score=52.90 TRINITY_DN17358_c0_g1_i1:8-1180(-)